jgi:hypothetical protein
MAYKQQNLLFTVLEAELWAISWVSDPDLFIVPSQGGKRGEKLSGLFL